MSSFWHVLMLYCIELGYYPRATRCGGDIVTLLWFRASVCAWFRPSVDLVNTIETKPLHISLSNLADMLTMMRGWTLLIFEVRGQRSRSQWRYIEISLWRRGDATLCVVIFSTYFNHVNGAKCLIHINLCTESDLFPFPFHEFKGKTVQDCNDTPVPGTRPLGL